MYIKLVNCHLRNRSINKQKALKSKLTRTLGVISQDKHSIALLYQNNALTVN